MGHLPALIHDLALILITGAIASLIFRKLRQPLVLGFIIAGFLVGPHFHFLPTVADTENIKTLAEIGVIFLLFSLGLEFSFKKLIRVGSTASITALFEIVFIMTAGYFTGRLLGWKVMDSLFLGGMLASSSTTIIIRAFDELGVKTRQFASIVFGVLIVEDIVVILLMVLLSTISISQQIEGSEILFTVVKLVFFLAAWFITGIFLLPTLLKRARNLINEETLLILSLGLCLGMVILATEVGFSAELGAFIMGSIIAETTLAEKVEHTIKPVKDLFGTIFFVSVGMMIDPAALMEYGWPVAIVTLLTLFGKLFSTTIGALLSGQPLKQSVQVGMSMAQIGEFAFIVATLGLSLGVISDFLFPVAVGASAITTFTTPYLIKYSERVYFFLEARLPASWLNRLNRYSISTQTIQAEQDWKSVLMSYVKIVLTNAIIAAGIFLLSQNFLFPFLEERISEPLLHSLIGLLISLGMAAPFIMAIIAKQPSSIAYKVMWLKKEYSRGPLLIVEILRLLVGIFIISFWVSALFQDLTAVLISVAGVVLILFLFARRLQKIYMRLENRFLGNLHARETEVYNSLAANVTRKKAQIQQDLQPWDAHIVSLEVPARALYTGRNLQELLWREKYGVNIVYIKRGDNIILPAGRLHFLLPFDKIGVIATDEQIKQFKPVVEATEPEPGIPVDVEAIMLEKVIVNEYTQLKGKSIRNSGIREKTNSLVVGIERKNQRILNPDSGTVFEWADVVWLVGDHRKIQQLKRNGLPEQNR